MEVIRHQEFLLLPACEVEKLLASDDMNVPEEETVVTALLSWVRHDVSTRQSQLPALLAHIRLPLLKPQVSQPSTHQSTGLLFCCAVTCSGSLISIPIKPHQKIINLL